MTSTVTALRTRPPTCKTAWPRILLAGPGGSGKSWQLATLSASDKIGRTLWLELVERKADEYGLVEGARFELFDHNGTYEDIVKHLEEARDAARAALAAGEKPWVLGLDSVSALWDMLKEWADTRARSTEANKAKLRRDPNADIKVSMNLWEDVAKRWRRIMTLLLTFPGIVVVTAKGRMVVATDDDGKPLQNAPKVYKVEARTGFEHDMFQVVRLSTEEPPVVVKNNSVHNGVRPGDPPVPVPNFGLEWFIFEVLKVDAATSAVPEAPALDAGELTEEERVTEQESGPAADEPPRWNGRQESRPAIVISRPPRRTPEKNREYAERGLTVLLAAEKPEDAAEVRDKATGDPVTRVDVSGSLRDYGQLLGIDTTVKVLWQDAADKIVAYVEREGMSVQSGLRLAAAEEADRPAEPSDHSAGTERPLGSEGAAA